MSLDLNPRSMVFRSCAFFESILHTFVLTVAMKYDKVVDLDFANKDKSCLIFHDLEIILV